MKKTIIVSLVALMFVGACSKKAENQISKEDVAIASQVPSTNGPPPRSDGGIGEFSAADVTRIKNAQVINKATGQPMSPADTSASPETVADFNKSYQLSLMGQWSKLPEACGWDKAPFADMKNKIYAGNKLDASYDDFWNKGVIEYLEKVQNGYNYKTEGTLCSDSFRTNLIKKLDKIYKGDLGNMASD